ncbi:hypothetical protein [Eisenbergiella porci]|uniref:hypothetical protein n=1 Tax=Eisenbergiella porci TaxID=2652274 RepID=UPI002A8122BE|nr:hypothetical protein [Eisenbergiella porci]
MNSSVQRTGYLAVTKAEYAIVKLTGSQSLSWRMGRCYGNGEGEGYYAISKRKDRGNCRTQGVFGGISLGTSASCCAGQLWEVKHGLV